MYPIKGNFIFQDSVTTTGDGKILLPDRGDSLTVFVTGTSSSRTIYFEGADFDGNWYAATAFKLPDYTKASSTTGTAEQWSIDITPYTQFRVRVGAVAGGTVRVVGKVVNSNG